jgi:hypothetical protein
MEIKLTKTKMRTHKVRTFFIYSWCFCNIHQQLLVSISVSIAVSTSTHTRLSMATSLRQRNAGELGSTPRLEDIFFIFFQDSRGFDS